jgi:hypothetical protein
MAPAPQTPVPAKRAALSAPVVLVEAVFAPARQKGRVTVPMARRHARACLIVLTAPIVILGRYVQWGLVANGMSVWERRFVAGVRRRMLRRGIYCKGVGQMLRLRIWGFGRIEMRVGVGVVTEFFLGHLGV